MANVGFKLGLQNSVDAIINAGKGAEEGSFYLTSDTHRLYIGAKSGDDPHLNEQGVSVNDITLFAVNEGVTSVKYVTDLPDYVATGTGAAGAGRFYYVEEDNILCVWTGQKWVQINPDTDTTISGDSKWELAENDDITTITLNLITNTTNGVSGVAHRITYSLIARNGILTSVENGRLVIEGDTYELSNDAVDDGKAFTISLNSENTDNDSTIKFKGNENINFFKDDDGVINLQVTNTGIGSVEVKNGQSAEDTVNGFSVVIKDSSGAAKRGSFNPIIKVGHDEDQKELYNFENGVADLDVYTGDELNTLLKHLNAMVYKGLMGDEGQVAVNRIDAVGNGYALMLGSDPVPASIGDTYMTVTEVRYDQERIPPGSLVICNSTDHTEGPDGIIPTDKMQIDIVKIDNKAATYYELISGDKTDKDGNIQAGIRLMSSQGSAVGELYIVDDGTNGGLVVSSSHKANAIQGYGDTETITISHVQLADGEVKISQNAPQSQGKVGSITIPVVTSIVTDRMGHLQELVTTDYTLTDTNGAVEKVEVLSQEPYKSINNETVGSFKITVETKDSAGLKTTKQDYFNLISSSLNISRNSKLGANSTSTEQQAGLSIDMVWGSF